MKHKHQFICQECNSCFSDIDDDGHTCNNFIDLNAVKYGSFTSYTDYVYHNFNAKSNGKNSLNEINTAMLQHIVPDIAKRLFQTDPMFAYLRK